MKVADMKCGAVNQRVESRESTLSFTFTSRMLHAHKAVISTRLLWFAIVLIHAMCIAFYSVMALVYYKLPDTVVSAYLRVNRLTLDMKHFPIVVVFHVICAVLHLVFLLEMLFMSARKRMLFFHRPSSRRNIRMPSGIFPASPPPPTTTTSSSPTSLVIASAVKRRASNVEVMTQSVRSASRRATKLWGHSFGYTGIFGVGGKNFALLFLIREATETILQSIQAYQLSVYAPRVWLNRLAVVVVTISCWSTPAIRRLFPQNPRLELILCLLFDIVLDFVSSVGVPIVFVMSYLPGYDSMTTDFTYAKWVDKVWITNLNNEFKLLFIQSWVDFIGRVLFAATLLLCLDDVKLLAAATDRLIFPRSEKAIKTHKATKVAPRWNRRIEKLVHGVLISWGCTILGLHLGSNIASGSGDVFGCMVQVRPWLGSRTACAYVDIDCQLHHPAMVGNATELEVPMSKIDANALSILIFRNCPNFHMPQVIRDFPQLKAIYLYNSTVVEWSESAALSQTHHPVIRQLTLIGVNLSLFANTTILPPGLLAPDFPSSVGTVYIAASGLTDLPSNLDTIWPKGINMIFVRSGATSMPKVFLRMQLMRLTLQYTRISDLPSELFEIPTLKWIEVNFNPLLNALPARVRAPSEILKMLNFEFTNVSVLPEWMTTSRFRSQVAVQGGNTPFCQTLAKQQDAAMMDKYHCAP